MPQHRSWAESLLGVGLPEHELALLLLIPLLAIGLTAAELVVSGRRRGPFDRFFRRTVAPGSAGTTKPRRRLHVPRH